VASRSIVVLVTGDPVPETLTSRGGFFELIRQAAPASRGLDWVARDARRPGPSPALTDALAVIVTGSPASVTERADWMIEGGRQLCEAVLAGTPVLGICFGHQWLGDALGGRVELNPRGREMGTVVLNVTESDAVVGGAGEVCVNATHVDSVVALPPGARVIGSTAQDPHAAVRFGPRAWGVQFHPEIDKEVMRHYLAARRDVLSEEGFDVARAERDASNTPDGAAVVDRFVALARQLGK
jgi:GMP synthase (glutamine-hydrolysing)